METYFDNLSKILDIGVSEKQQIKPLLNWFTKPDSKILDIKLKVRKWENNDLINLTEEDYKKKAFNSNELTLISNYNEYTKTYKNDKGYFNVRELCDIIVDFEKRDRPNSNWFGGIDIHHIYLDQMAKQNKYLPNNIYALIWGS